MDFWPPRHAPAFGPPADRSTPRYSDLNAGSAPNTENLRTKCIRFAFLIRLFTKSTIRSVTRWGFCVHVGGDGYYSKWTSSPILRGIRQEFA